MMCLLQEVLKMELNRLQQFFQEVKVCRLPLNPALVVQGIEADVSLAHAMNYVFCLFVRILIWRGGEWLYCLGNHPTGIKDKLSGKLSSRIIPLKLRAFVEGRGEGDYWARYCLSILPCAAAAHISNSQQFSLSSALLLWCWAWQRHLDFIKMTLVFHSIHVALNGSFFPSKTVLCHRWGQLNI